ncbi:PadR family transcriptional regulator [Tenggerimyces flavus]|uniref:PadR family transcriptional regulator n=1 Tax=Tenggerimyces flavus TaxID=1708749 RepID=A0ABV7YQ09_9ACTN|nr:helix-turn-helix transcriptional regulator [Tenggerimyces flavus]MBM7784392.1 DNA-binding PadR family transcriptional regulator [Tenggerimyces flavus]
MERLERIGKATVDVLGVLLEAKDPQWGLAIIKATGRPSGSVYPMLERLERAGWVTSSWEDEGTRRGPRRRLYALTKDGAAEARKVRAAKAASAGHAGRLTRPVAPLPGVHPT